MHDEADIADDELVGLGTAVVAQLHGCVTGWPLSDTVTPDAGSNVTTVSLRTKRPSVRRRGRGRTSRVRAAAAGGVDAGLERMSPAIVTQSRR